MIYLIINDIDISEWVEADSYRVDRIDNYDIDFTSYTGEKIKKCAGYEYKLNVKMSNVPDDIACDIIAALNSDFVNVTYTNPHFESGIENDAVFVRQENISAVIDGEDIISGIDTWSFDIDITSAYHKSGKGYL